MGGFRIGYTKFPSTQKVSQTKKLGGAFKTSLTSEEALTPGETIFGRLRGPEERMTGRILAHCSLSLSLVNFASPRFGKYPETTQTSRFALLGNRLTRRPIFDNADQFS